MAMVCGKCKAYDAEGNVKTCPTCELPMQFTLLPPSNGPAAPLNFDESKLPVRRPAAAPQGSSQWSELFGFLFRSRLLLRLLMIPIFGTGGYFGVQAYDHSKTGKNPSDPMDLRAKFDDVQDKLNNPQPIAGFTPTNNPTMMQVTPPQQVTFKNPSPPFLPTPPPPAPPNFKRPPGR